MMITTACLIPCTAEEIPAPDLQRDMTENADVEWETYRVASEQHTERGSLIFSRDVGRGAVAFGADAEWTDAFSPGDVLRRWIADEMVN